MSGTGRRCADATAATGGGFGRTAAQACCRLLRNFTLLDPPLLLRHAESLLRADAAAAQGASRPARRQSRAWTKAAPTSKRASLAC